MTPFVEVADLPPVPPGHTVFFHPQRPTRGHELFYFLEKIGWRIVDRPEIADWRILYHVDTLIRLGPDDPYADLAATWLNGRCRDISKRRVERTFADVFGYELAVDPTTWHGRCLRKADRNSVNDGSILQCPILASEVRAGQVYERLVDGRQPDGRLLEYRVFVVGNTLPIMHRKLHTNWHESGKLAINVRDVQVVPPQTDFSAAEIDLILEFCHVSGLDIGVLDVIRDVEDGRVYVLDVTKTPGVARWTITPAMLEAVAGPFCRAWLASFPPATR
jgi:hypothetical protein